MKIIKCGGSSLKEYENRLKIYNMIKNSDDTFILIVSAFNDCPYSTKSLKGLITNNYDYEMEQELITIGEIISSIRVTNELKNESIDATLIYKEQVGIFVETSNKMEQIVGYDGKYIKEKSLLHKVVVVPGFIGINQDDKIVSLNENGSDLSAIIVAKMLDINDVYLYKDVLGLASIDPSFESNYKLYSNVSYDMMLQISLHGSNLIQNEAIKFAKDNDINIHIQHYLNNQYCSNITKNTLGRVIVFQILNKDIYIDGFNNSSLIENILINKNIKYDYILPCNLFVKIVSSYGNEIQIIKMLHQMYLKGEL